MSLRLHAPLRATVEIFLPGEHDEHPRIFRLTHSISMPSTLHFEHPFPPINQKLVGLRFALPHGIEIDAQAELSYEPDQIENWCQAHLVGLSPLQHQAIQSYIEGRNLT